MASNLAAIQAATSGLMDLRDGMDATAKGAQSVLTNAAGLEAAAMRLEQAAKARSGLTVWMILTAALLAR